MSNLPILYRNIISGIDHEDATDLFLKLVDRVGVLNAERAAYLWKDMCEGLLNRPLQLALNLHKAEPEVEATVKTFIRERFPAAIERGLI